MTGRGQAVRLPKEYRVTGNSVYVKRLGNSIVLIPEASDRWAGLFAALDGFPRDFALDKSALRVFTGNPTPKRLMPVQTPALPAEKVALLMAREPGDEAVAHADG